MEMRKRKNNYNMITDGVPTRTGGIQTKKKKTENYGRTEN